MFGCEVYYSLGESVHGHAINIVTHFLETRAQPEGVGTQRLDRTEGFSSARQPMTCTQTRVDSATNVVQSVPHTVISSNLQGNIGDS